MSSIKAIRIAKFFRQKISSLMVSNIAYLQIEKKTINNLSFISATFTEDVIKDYFPLFNHEHLTRYIIK